MRVLQILFHQIPDCVRSLRIIFCLLIHQLLIDTLLLMGEQSGVALAGPRPDTSGGVQAKGVPGSNAVHVARD